MKYSLLKATIVIGTLLSSSSALAQAPKTIAGRTVDQYSEQLTNANRTIRLRAVKSLGAFGEAAGPALQSALAHDDPAVVYTAAVHLGRIGGEPLKGCVAKLQTIVNNQDSLALRMASAFALCRAGNVDENLSVIIQALEHPNRGMVCSAAELLGMLGRDGAAAVDALEAVYKKHKPGVKGGDYHKGGAANNALRKIRRKE